MKTSSTDHVCGRAKVTRAYGNSLDELEMIAAISAMDLFGPGAQLFMHRDYMVIDVQIPEDHDGNRLVASITVCEVLT